MSQPIYCTAPECGAEADTIIGDTHSGDQTPLCYPHLYDWCGAWRAMVDDNEIEQVDAEAEARIASVKAPAGSDQAPETYTCEACGEVVPTRYEHYNSNSDMFECLITADDLERARLVADDFNPDGRDPSNVADRSAQFPATAKVVRSTHGHRSKAAKGRSEAVSEALPDDA